MAILNYALLSALLPAVLAAPGLHGRGMGHGPYTPSGKLVYPTGFPHPSGPPSLYHHPSGAPVGTAPFPAQNATAKGISTGGRGPVTIQSTINLVPVPVTDTLYSAGQSPESTGAAGVGGPGGVGSPAPSGVPGVGTQGSPAGTAPGSGAESPATGSAGSGPGGVGSSPTGAPGASGAPGSGVEAGTCGPAIVTVTQAQTVTVTVPAGSSSGAPGAPGASGAPGSGPGESPGQSAPGAPEGGPSSAPTFSAPFPIGNSSASAGPTGTGPVVVSTATGAPTLHHPVPLPAHSVASVVNSPAPAVVNSPAPAVVSSPAPSEVATSAALVTASSVPVEALFHVPGQNHPQSASQQSSVTFAAPQAQATTTSAPQAPAQAPTSAGPSSSPAPKSSPVSSSGGVKARGLLYGSLSAAQSFDTSNIGWGWDWDSSPSPASGHATGSLGGIQFVPMLLSTADVHTSLWEGNSAGAEWVMGFNEPDQCGGGGSCMSVSDVVSGWGTYFSGLSASKCSPATTNDLTTQGKGLSYMSDFLAACTGCKFDALAFHYYGSGSDTSALISTIQAYQKLQKQYGIPELWIPEMAPTDQPSADEVNALLAVLDNPANGVTRYAFNGLNTGTGIQLAGEIASAYCS